MSWESATSVLYAARPTAEQVDALGQFVDAHRAELAACYAPEHAASRPRAIKFVSRLFELYEKPGADHSRELAALVERTAVRLLSSPDFFPNVFRAGLLEADTHLLELAYASLFTVIPASSDLAAKWFEVRLDAERRNVKYTPQAWALNVLTSVQFLDVGQDWAAARPSTELLCSIQDSVNESSETVVKLVWALVLFFLAKHHYSTDDDDGVDLDPLMRKLQVRAGVHWNAVLRDEIQVSLGGLGSLVAALELIRAEPPALVPEQQFAQTAADAISKLVDVSKPTDGIMAALATAVKPYPALKLQQWVSPKYLALIKAKCPASIASLVSVAQTLSFEDRVEYLREMTTYVSEVQASELDLGGLDVDDAIGQSVRTSTLVTILPARITDHQGKLELDVGTRGTLLGQDGADCLVMWYFTYNGWSLLGRVFENTDLLLGNKWEPLTIEILELVTMTMDAGVLAAMSAGLARGDLVDLVVRRLQMWLHDSVMDNTPLAFSFLVALVRIDAPRVWVVLDAIDWVNIYDSALVYEGLRKLLLALWPTFEATSDLHIRVVDKLTRIFAWQYQSQHFNVGVLQVFEILLPINDALHDELLSSSPLRETSLAPLLANLDKREVLEFCTYCIGNISTSGANSGSAGLRASTGSSRRLLPPQTLEFRKTEPSFLETQIFAKAKLLVGLFINEPTLRRPLLELVTVLVLNESAPPLLAFLETGQATQFQDKLVDMASDKLQSSTSLAELARWFTAIRRQEGLLELLRQKLLPLFEDRVIEVTNPHALIDIFEALKLLKGSFKPKTLEFLRNQIDEHIEETSPERVEAKKRAIELLRKQLSTDPSQLKHFVSEISQLTPRLVKIEGIRPTLHSRLKHNLRNKWPALGDNTTDIDVNLTILDNELKNDPMWHSSYRLEVVEASENAKWIQAQTSLVTSWCELMATACVEHKKLSLTSEVKQQWVIELLKANSSVLPLILQQAEDVRTEAALYILQQNLSPRVDILDMLFQQMTDITMNPMANATTAESSSQRPRLLSLQQMVSLLLPQFEVDTIKKEPRLVQIVLGLLDVIVIKQTRVFGGSEEWLQLQLSILRDSLRILAKEGASDMLSPLVQSMTESGADVAAVQAYALTPVQSPVLGELILLYIQEWLPVGIMTDNFVRTGLINMLIEAPLSRYIQKGDILPYEQPAMHSLWRHGILVVILRLLNQLGSRVAQESWLFLGTYGQQIATCFDQWRVGTITLALIEETVLLHTLISLLGQLDANPNDKVDVVFPKDELVQTIDHLSSHRKYLSTRVPATEDTSAILNELGDLRNFVLA